MAPPAPPATSGDSEVTFRFSSQAAHMSTTHGGGFSLIFFNAERNDGML